MAYSSPSSRSTGDLVTAAIWNQDVVDNVEALYNNPVGLAASPGHYDSGWFAVTNDAATHTKAHGLGVQPRLVKLLWAASNSSPTYIYEVKLLQYGASAYYGAGMRIDATNIVAKTGTGATGGTVMDIIQQATGGYYRILAWA